MASSDGTRVIGNDRGEFNLTVQYKTKVLRFAVNGSIETNNITVNENDAVNLTCELEGNPLPTGTLLHQRLSYILNQYDEALHRNSTSKDSNNLRLASSFLAQCTDTGIQTCFGRNTLHNGLQSASDKSVLLFVMCKPRKSPFFTILDTIQSPTSVDVTLSFTALAYPVPEKSGFVWSRKLETNDTWDTWTNITSSGRKFIIITWGIQSNLTTKDVSQLDYGLYRLIVDNGIGKFNFTFGLIHSADTNGDLFSSNIRVVAGAVVGVIILVAIIVIVTVVVYRRRKQTATTKRDSSIQYYNFNDSKVVELNIPPKAGNANEYEALQHKDSDHRYERVSPVAFKMDKDVECNFLVENGSLNVYEGLQTTGSDQQYAKLSPIPCKVEKDAGNSLSVEEELRTTEPHMVYENLQLTRNTEGLQDGDASRTAQTDSH